MADKIRFALAVFALALVAACGETPNQLSPNALGGFTHPPLPTPTPVGLKTPPPGSIYLGAYVGGVIGIVALEATIGRTLAIDPDYRNWVSKIPSGQANDDLRYGRIYFASWDCGISNAAVAAGQDDALIKTAALSIKKYGHTVFLRYMWDANMPATYLGRQQCYDPATDNADGTFSATKYIAAYRHIHQIFASNGVTNVDWVWSFNPESGTNDPIAYYPGDDVVDWIGIDAYANPYISFTNTFQVSYALFQSKNKPMIVSETGATPPNQVAFFTGAPNDLKTNFPLIQAFVYYDAVAQNGFNWSFGADGGAQFNFFAHDPYTAAMPSSV